MAEEITKTTISTENDPNNPPQSAYFVSLTVENFRCFGPAQTLRLADENNKPYQWTILIGENGVGKTTLLELLILQQVKVANINNSDYKIKLSINWLIYNLASVKRNISSLISISSKVINSPSLNSPSNVNSVFELYCREMNGYFNINHTINIDGLIAYMYGADRKNASVRLSDTFIPNKELYNSLYSELKDAEEWFLQVDYAAIRGSDPTKLKQRDRVKEILIKLLPDVEDLRVSDPNVGTFIEAKTPYGWVPVQSMSLGYQSMMTWMVDLAARLFERYPNSEDPLAEPAIVLIDEIDLHLHPRWQRQLFDLVGKTFVNTQFIVTTHSPLVVQAAKDANIVLLRRKDDHVEIVNDIEQIHNWRIDQIITSQLFDLPTARPPQVEKALQERNKILGKSKLTAKDKERLAQLDAEIGDMPAGETLADAQAMDIIRRAAAMIRENQGGYES